MKFERKGLLAITPQALATEYEPKKPLPQISVAVDIRGPLTHHEDFWGDSYDSIRERVSAALSLGDTVYLRIDSPGGDVSGVFELGRDLTKMAEQSGKELIAYVDGMACSAAYAIAASCSKIYLPETAYVGSIGVIAIIQDVSQHLGSMGIKTHLISSGARKADGSPLAPMSPESKAEIQRQVDGLADYFYEYVSSRRGLEQGTLRTMEAGIYNGKAAVSVGLADGTVESFSALLDMRSQQEEQSMSKMEEVKEALAAIAENGSDEEKEQAKKCLAALEPPEEEQESPEEEPAHEEPDGDEAKASVSSVVKAAVAAEMKTIRDEIERDRLLASRPDIGAEAKVRLQNKPLAVVREVLAMTPRAASVNPAAATFPNATRGAGQPSRASNGDALDAMDRAFGRKSSKTPAIEMVGTTQLIGALVGDEKRRAIAAKKAGN